MSWKFKTNKKSCWLYWLPQPVNNKPKCSKMFLFNLYIIKFYLLQADKSLRYQRILWFSNCVTISYKTCRGLQGKGSCSTFQWITILHVAGGKNNWGSEKSQTHFKVTPQHLMMENHSFVLRLKIFETSVRSVKAITPHQSFTFHSISATTTFSALSSWECYRASGYL